MQIRQAVSLRCGKMGPFRWVGNAADTRPLVRVTAQPHGHVCGRPSAHHPRLDLCSAAPRGSFCVSRRSGRCSGHRRQGPPPLPYDTATIGAALARASAGNRPPARRRAGCDGRRAGPIGTWSGPAARLTELNRRRERRRGGPSAGFRRGPAGAEEEERARTVSLGRV